MAEITAWLEVGHKRFFSFLIVFFFLFSFLKFESEWYLIFGRPQEVFFFFLNFKIAKNLYDAWHLVFLEGKDIEENVTVFTQLNTILSTKRWRLIDLVVGSKMVGWFESDDDYGWSRDGWLIWITTMLLWMIGIIQTWNCLKINEERDFMQKQETDSDKNMIMNDKDDAHYNGE